MLPDPFPNRLCHKHRFCWLVCFSFCSDLGGKDSENEKPRRHFKDLRPLSEYIFGNRYRLCTVLLVGNTAKNIAACGTG